MRETPSTPHTDPYNSRKGTIMHPTDTAESRTNPPHHTDNWKYKQKNGNRQTPRPSPQSSKPTLP